MIKGTCLSCQILWKKSLIIIITTATFGTITASLGKINIDSENNNSNSENNNSSSNNNSNSGYNNSSSGKNDSNNNDELCHFDKAFSYCGFKYRSSAKSFWMFVSGNGIVDDGTLCPRG